MLGVHLHLAGGCEKAWAARKGDLAAHPRAFELAVRVVEGAVREGGNRTGGEWGGELEENRRASMLCGRGPSQSSATACAVSESWRKRQQKAQVTSAAVAQALLLRTGHPVARALGKIRTLGEPRQTIWNFVRMRHVASPAVSPRRPTCSSLAGALPDVSDGSDATAAEVLPVGFRELALCALAATGGHVSSSWACR
ncbi:hypothetical protein KFL_001160130 [Klebsormidium nitens]|uniref:Uncharacterized protein n=1 Tax=Klebsormidium nitens TaxID=105231 RepID=A0A1Y1HVB8_KLENI|nr:hypothetical protein KFL_001160130 [Klebsormidium nitens]|eukprot:GAQ82580.1 hypothetical protein KFL_001160130 [Klebsormidium nitens]